MHDDGERQCWATIRGGLGAGLCEPIDLDADDRPAAQKRRRAIWDWPPVAVRRD